MYNKYKGNPTTHLSNNLVWEGRKLKSFNNNTFEYNADGRTSKTENGGFVGCSRK